MPGPPPPPSLQIGDYSSRRRIRGETRYPGLRGTLITVSPPSRRSTLCPQRGRRSQSTGVPLPQKGNKPESQKKNCGPSTIQPFNQPKPWAIDYGPSTTPLFPSSLSPSAVFLLLPGFLARPHMQFGYNSHLSRQRQSRECWPPGIPESSAQPIP